MYMVRDGPLIEHAAQFRRGGLSKPVFCGCGLMGFICCIGGAVALSLRKTMLKAVVQDST